MNMNVDSKVTYNMNALNVTTQEDNTNILLKLFLYIVLRYFI
jgi:hypothetical protein